MSNQTSEGQNATLSLVSATKEVIRIAADGRIFWLDREVESDDDFRAAMLYLVEQLKKVVT